MHQQAVSKVANTSTGKYMYSSQALQLSCVLQAVKTKWLCPKNTSYKKYQGWVWELKVFAVFCLCLWRAYGARAGNICTASSYRVLGAVQWGTDLCLKTFFTPMQDLEVILQGSHCCQSLLMDSGGTAQLIDLSSSSGHLYYRTRVKHLCVPLMLFYTV